MRAVLALVAFAATAAIAVDVPAWPPAEGTVQRMRELQEVIRDGASTAGEREAAREELSGLLKSPAGQQRGRTADEKPARPARAAIDPLPSHNPIVAPRLPPPPPSGEVARLEVVVPPKPIVNPQLGTAIAPTGRFAIDPRTGNVLHEAGAGFVDPKTGQFTPR